uniref:ATP-dependent DNA helicase n=1 Tax=Bactrocera latifrons TaxID=174628 RepID=A0A0K8VHV1_BACLA
MTMTNKKSLEALDRTMKDLRGNQQLFGAALILLSGDFRQTLPRSTPADEINACLKSSALWRFVKKIVNVNMRVLLQDDSSAQQFSEQLLDIGNGKMQIDNTNGIITLPENFCTILQTKEELVECVFPNIIQNHRSHDWLAERSILAPKNIHVNAMNCQFQEKLPGEVITYKSIDRVLDEDEAVNYPIEFLNSLEPPGTPPHLLNLKAYSLL